MSHNAQKLNSQEPNIQGVTSQSLNDLADVSITGSLSDKVLKRVGAAWVAASPLAPLFNAGGYAAGHSQYTAGSGSSYTSTGALDSYRTHTLLNWSEANADTSRIQFGGVSITRGTHGGSTPSQVRFSKIVVDPGKYLLLATTRAPISSSSNYIEFQWLNTDTDAALGPRWRQYGSAADDVGYGIGYVECTSGTITCDVRVMSNTGGTDQARAYGDILAALQIG